MKEIYCYSDGSSVVNGKLKGQSGFGTYFPNLFGERKAFSLGFKNGKTGQMEVLALLYAILAMPKHSPEPIKLIVYSDSEYVVKTFTENRLQRWIAAGWKNSSGDVKNQDLWKGIDNGLNDRKYLQLEMRHIRSHQVEKEKDPDKKAALLKCPHIQGNMVADFLADYKRHKILL